jgi:hypothetical protein
VYPYSWVPDRIGFERVLHLLSAVLSSDLSEDFDKKQGNLAVALSKLQQRIYKTMAEALLNSEIKREDAEKDQDEVPECKYAGMS